jgi:hypothetical protein
MLASFLPFDQQARFTNLNILFDTESIAIGVRGSIGHAAGLYQHLTP